MRRRPTLIWFSVTSMGRFDTMILLPSAMSGMMGACFEPAAAGAAAAPPPFLALAMLPEYLFRTGPVPAAAVTGCTATTWTCCCCPPRPAPPPRAAPRPLPLPPRPRDERLSARFASMMASRGLSISIVGCAGTEIDCACVRVEVERVEVLREGLLQDPIRPTKNRSAPIKPRAGSPRVTGSLVLPALPLPLRR